MEQITYFQGEDLVIHAQAYTDNTCSETESLADYTVDVILYTDENERIFRGNSERTIDFEVSFMTSGAILIELPSDLSRQFKPGNLRMELSLKDSDGGAVRIAKCALARIEPSLMSKVLSYDN